MDKKNIFRTINLIKEEYTIPNKLSQIHYNMLLDSNKIEDANEYFDSCKELTYSLVIKPTDRAREYAMKYKNLLINQYYPVIDIQHINDIIGRMLEVSVMTDIYMTLRHKIRGRGAQEKKDDLAIQFFSYAFSYLEMNPFSVSDRAVIETLTNIDIGTGDYFPKPKKDKRIKFIKRKRFCIGPR